MVNGTLGTAHIIGEIVNNKPLWVTEGGALYMNILVFHEAPNGTPVKNFVTVRWFHQDAHDVVKKYKVGDRVDIQALVKTEKPKGSAYWNEFIAGDQIKLAGDVADQIAAAFDAEDLSDGIPF